ncbi:NAD(P)H-hydrate dehydratase [Infirmifilum sp.]|uniref:NAD(P)H-hydrate dehydratase n=1 Tax=Infirmifilum sp. TaxID=2856575 RepID=UPI003D0A9DD4
MKVARVEDIKRMDELASTKYGISQEILMENAGASVARLIESFADARGLRVVVVAGVGNNGGDGLVAARHLASQGADVKVYIIGDLEKITTLARINLDRIMRMGLPVEHVAEDISGLSEELHQADVVIDALFGIGLNRPVSGLYARVIDAVNGSGSLVVSVDIPSGVNGDTGQVMGVAVKADYTVTFGLPKPGLLIYPGAEHAGEIYVARISYPIELLEDETLVIETNDPVQLPERKPDTHKGDYGKALFIAGSRRYMGAPLFSAYSFLLAGGGYSRLATASSIVPYLGSKASEVVYEPLLETPSGSISYANKDRLLELAEWADIVAMGPGLTTEEETLRLVRDLVPLIKKPLILDGDGLTAVAGALELIRKREAPTILTPHLGEVSRLTGISVERIREDRIGFLRTLCRELNSYIVLKGAHTLVGTPSGKIYVNLTGNPGMAKAGSGDVLVGVIAAMLGLGLDVGEATRMAVLVHGYAGDYVASLEGIDGVTASRMMRVLPRVLRELRENPEDFYRSYSLQTL